MCRLEMMLYIHISVNRDNFNKGGKNVVSCLMIFPNRWNTFPAQLLEISLFVLITVQAKIRKILTSGVFYG